MKIKERPHAMSEQSSSRYRQSVYIADNIIDFFKAKKYLEDR